MRRNPLFVGAAMAFALSDVFGSVVSMRENLDGEPFGISTPISPSLGVLVGWGAATGAPWPMPLAALVAATWHTAADAAASPGPRAHLLRDMVVGGVGAGCIIGTVIEPVSLGRRKWTPAIRAAIACNLATSSALVITAVASRARVRRELAALGEAERRTHPRVAHR